MKRNPVLVVNIPYGPGNTEIEGEIELDWEDIVDIVSQLDEEDKARLIEVLSKS